MLGIGAVSVVLGVVLVPVWLLDVPVCPVPMLGDVVAEPVALVPVCPVAVPAEPAVPALAPPVLPDVPATCILAAIKPAVAYEWSAADGRPLVQ